MTWLWTWIVAWLVWLSADPQRLATEPARASAAVSAAKAAMLEKGK